MTTASQALSAGNLDDALAIATAAVKASPTDADARWVMAELLLLSGQPDRADKMLDAAALRDPNPAVMEFRKLLRAAVIREQVMREGRAPKYQGGSATPAQMLAMQARMYRRLNDMSAAAQAAQQVEEQRPRVPGVLVADAAGEHAFDDLRDLDDLLAAEFEILTSAGDYMLVATENVRSLEFDAPKRPRDLAWRRCAIETKDGTEGVVFMPALYVGMMAETEPAFQLGRTTEWSRADDGPACGRGQRLLLAGEEAFALTGISRIEFQ